MLSKTARRRAARQQKSQFDHLLVCFKYQVHVPMETKNRKCFTVQVKEQQQNIRNLNSTGQCVHSKMHDQVAAQ